MLRTPLAFSCLVLAACGGQPQPGLSCPRGMVAVWVADPGGLAECQADLPLRDGRMSATGLEQPFPAMPRPQGSLNSPERIELGRLLFFDPVLSGDNSLSCAHCHHPDRGFSDGRGKGVGIHDTPLPRGVPTVWNAAFNQAQFWDGRAPTLEEQAKGPIQNPKEMAQDPVALVSELQKIPEYKSRFDQAFGGTAGSGVTFENVVSAIATFERSVLTYGSPFDRYAAGDSSALSDAQRRGLGLFRSVSTRCFECHGPPTFANPDYKVIGIPDADDPTRMDSDIGRAAIVPGAAYEHAFKVPTLRNVARTAPYMHDGAFKTLEEVLDYYSGGGGPGHGFVVPNVDDKIHKYDLSMSERADLVAFLNALTDESLLPEVPASVPSGFPVVARVTSP